MFMPEFESRATCPHCGSEHESATGVGVDAPASGAFSICSKCGEFAVFGDDMRLRPMTAEEREMVLEDAGTQYLRAQVGNARARADSGDTTPLQPGFALGLYTWNRKTDEVAACSNPKEWAMKFENGTGRTVNKTDVPGVGLLSTVFLGIDHGFGFDGGPRQLFETALLTETDGVDIIARYPNPEDARQSHDRIALGLLEQHAETVEQARAIIAAVMHNSDS